MLRNEALYQSMVAYDRQHGTSDAPEMPWWVGFLVRAERWGKAPWELYEGREMKACWFMCDDIWQSAQRRSQQPES